jgi:hypothetical protein
VPYIPPDFLDNTAGRTLADALVRLITEWEQTELDAATGFFEPHVWQHLKEAFPRLERLRLLLGRPHAVASSQLRRPAGHVASDVSQGQVGEIDQQGLVLAGHSRPPHLPGPDGQLHHRDRRSNGCLSPGLDTGQQFPGQRQVARMSLQVIDKDACVQPDDGVAI